MKLRVVTLVASGALLATACVQESSLVVDLQLEPEVKASCVSLSVIDPNTLPPQLLHEERLSRPFGKDSYRVAIFRGTFPREVSLLGQALQGAGCADPLALVSSSAAVRRAFDDPPPRAVELYLPAPADGLVVTPPASPLAIAGCALARVEARFDGGVRAVQANTPVALAVTPGGWFAAYSDTSCLTAVDAGLLAAGTSSFDVRVRALDAGTFTLTASASGFTTGIGTVTAEPLVPTGLGFSNAPVAALRNACFGPLTVQPLYPGGLPANAASQINVGLSGDLSGVTFSASPSCSPNITSVSILAGSPGASVYARSGSAGALTVTASATGFTPGTQQEEIVPTVRTGTCRMGLGVEAVSCAIPGPPVFSLSRAFAMVQAISNDDSTSGVETVCTLGSATAIDCARDAGTGVVDIRWHLAELPSGINVQRVTNNCSAGNPMTLPQAFNPAQSFVLHTTMQRGGAVDENDHKTVRLVGTQQVEFLSNSGCGGSATTDVQVVDLTGATVDRGTTGAFGGASLAVNGGGNSNLGRTFLLHSARFASTDGGPLCGYQVRGELTSGSNITFTRGNGAAGPACLDPYVSDVAWERVQLPNGYAVQQLVLGISDGGSSASAALAQPIDPARSLTFASGAFPSGQSSGETNYNGLDVPGAASAVVSVGASNRVDLTRAVDAGTARWTIYAVEFP